GAMAAAYIATLEAKRKREDPEHVWNLLMWGLIGGILGARLYHVLSLSPTGANPGFNYYFIEQPFTTLTLFGVEIPFPTALLIWRGGIGIFGGIIGGLLTTIIYTRKNQLYFWRWLDIMAPGMLLAQAMGRWGNYFNQELYGPPTGLPWGILITNPNQRIPPYDNLTQYPLNTTFHPVFLYESLWNLVGFLLLFWIARRFADKLLDGDLASLYFIWYPVGRIFTESIRLDVWSVGGIPTAQIFSALLILAGLGLIYYRRHNPALATNPATHPTAQPKVRRPARK
ncbi:MAG: prolipoprotein diacylglyceryl transferase, partial [Chloroflexota bacterium]